MKKKIALFVVITMLLQLFSLTVSAENIQIDNSEQIATENNQPGIAIASSSWPWATTNKATKIVSSPYDGINTTIANLNSGDGFYIIERDYEYFYVQRTVNGKFQQGYVKMADVNYSSYSWASHNIFQRGVTAFSASSQQVLSGPGTVNSYENVGTIYKGESPLLLLRTEVNTYNNVTYCFIQYKVSGAEQYKRGWVPYSAVSISSANSSTNYIDTNKLFYLESKATGKMIQAISSSANSYVNQQAPALSSNLQIFKIESASSGYYRFVSQANTNLSLQVIGNQMKEGARLGLYTKGTTGAPCKAEEFEVTVQPDGSFVLKSRCTGLYRSVDLYGGQTANGTNIISSLSGDVSNQKWHFQPKIKYGNDISIIKVGDSTGRACVSMYNTFGTNKLNVYYANKDELIDHTQISKNNNFNTPHINFAIRNSSVFYVNGHGYTTPSMGDCPKELYDITPQNIGFQTGDRARWGILSPCSQLIKDGSAVVWANYALRKGVRGILGYNDVAPHDELTGTTAQVPNMETFTMYLNSNYTFANSWYLANTKSLTSYNANWAVIYHASAAQDKLSNYNTTISNPTTSTIYYAARNHDAAPLELSSSINMNSFIQENSTASSQYSQLTKNKKMTLQTDGRLLYQKESFDILYSDATVYTKEQVTNVIADFLLEEGISYNDDVNFNWGKIKRSVLSADGTSFENEETIAYTVLIVPEDTNDGNGIYLEVTNEGVVRCESDIKQ